MPPSPSPLPPLPPQPSHPPPPAPPPPILPFVALAFAGVWAVHRLAHVLLLVCRRIADALAAARRYIARRLSSPKDLSQFDLSTVRRPNWRVGVAHETRPCCSETPMFSPGRSRQARVSEGDEEMRLLRS